MSAGLLLVQMIAWWSRDNKHWDVSRGSQLTAHRSPWPSVYFKEQTWSSHAWCIEHHIEVAPVTDHCMWDQFNRQNLVYRFMSPIWQLAETLAREFSVFCSQWHLLALSNWFHNLYTPTGSKFWPLCSARATSTTLPNRLCTVCDPSLTISVFTLMMANLHYLMQSAEKENTI